MSKLPQSITSGTVQKEIDREKWGTERPSKATSQRAGSLTELRAMGMSSARGLF
jgi:hypothetical protein